MFYIKEVKKDQKEMQKSEKALQKKYNKIIDITNTDVLVYEKKMYLLMLLTKMNSNFPIHGLIKKDHLSLIYLEKD